MGSHPVQWTTNDSWPSVEHVRVDHRRFHVAMAQQLLDRFECQSRFKQVCGSGQVERMLAEGCGIADTANQEPQSLPNPVLLFR